MAKIDKAFLLSTALPLAEAAYGVVSDAPAMPAGFSLIAAIKLNAAVGAGI